MMPSREEEYSKDQGSPRMDGTNSEGVGSDWLADQLKYPEKTKVLVIDCRCPSDFHESHVRGAINLTLPASVIMLRRLANGKLAVPNVIKDPGHREKFMKLWQSHTIVLYDAASERIRPSGPCVMSTLYRRLVQENCKTVYLQGGFETFREKMPEWCESDASEGASEAPLGLLENLRITHPSESDTDPERCDSGLDRDSSPNDPPFPVEILPHLFLGNAENSRDLEALEKHHIRYILNVTPNLPNAFEAQGLGIKYMQIPIQDHWSQNLASFFPEAIAFIEEARQKKEGVLVHCLAGISRSVTITLAYLMQKLSMPLNDAYDFVRQRKANISPNFNFMGQLMDFERQLNLTPCHCTCQETPCRCQTLHFISPTRTTPDSGIDIDRWT